MNTLKTAPFLFFTACCGATRSGVVTALEPAMGQTSDGGFNLPAEFHADDTVPAFRVHHSNTNQTGMAVGAYHKATLT